ncbi:MAG TPA: hypothetical protein ENG87_03105 [Candidatus Pacearchaeota archaeon]|nr:hypothetical protein BMS3Abin17_00142 [archaeon BMS3Abin17]HDK42341.1 hypothetical protein [Candidatus Pacearchaeota archaeon]HDZ60289.1 hypothetical protein [Candidatus Pacearchaeota archaeon]
MKEKKIGLRYKGKKITIEVRDCSLLEMARGLIFRRKEGAPSLLFDFKNKKRENIHSFFVFFPFVALWLDDQNNVIEIKIVKPFNFYIRVKKNYSKILEIPINKKNNKIIGLLVGDKKDL